ncbi:hypothetical protein GCM10027280_59700 [Micromonospora polyrhachis]|uniref:GNAT superfamily N-acetyltransferase n=1 Tax=Micromonospora polyrhachis TaxID=1282883 RepID=A0A7W7SUK4_9ACTN|nr:GNAT family N-acetyltransferase [Micromonospora polyrhachis]MBB4961224.1 GNAT superfamily N-acetyltransferase [Micromonospora polyrhachis]
MSALVKVVRARWGDIGALAALAATAMRDLPAAGWLVSDPGWRTAVLTAYLRIHVEHALMFGEIDVIRDDETGGLVGAAVWLHRYRPIPPPAGYPHRLADTCGGHADRFTRLEELLAKQHPAEAHHHLAWLAVTPAAQQQGHDHALLAHHHARLDRTGIHAYTVTADEQVGDWYARHGYTPHNKTPAGGGLVLHGMWRPSPPPEDDKDEGD